MLLLNLKLMLLARKPFLKWKVRLIINLFLSLKIRLLMKEEFMLIFLNQLQNYGINTTIENIMVFFLMFLILLF